VTRFGANRSGIDEITPRAGGEPRGVADGAFALAGATEVAGDQVARVTERVVGVVGANKVPRASLVLGFEAGRDIGAHRPVELPGVVANGEDPVEMVDLVRLRLMFGVPIAGLGQGAGAPQKVGGKQGVLEAAIKMDEAGIHLMDARVEASAQDDAAQLVVAFLGTATELFGEERLRAALVVPGDDDDVAVAAVETFKADGEDNSRFWRPSLLADEDDPYGPDARDALVDAVRSIAEILVSSGQTTLQQALNVLEQHRALIFRRLALHLVREYGQDDPGLIRCYLFERDLLADRGAEYEFQLFLRDVHALLEPQRCKLVDAILAGPDTGPWKNRFSEAHDYPNPDAMVQQLAGMWIRDRLAPLEPVLDTAARDRYQQLVAQYGPASDLSVAPVRFVSSWTEESPVDAGELQALPAAELVDFLARWQPPQDWRGLDRSAICKALSASIAAAAEQRSHDADVFAGVDPAHASAILEGFAVAARDRRELDWAALIEFFRWVDDQAAVELAAMVTTRADRQWRQARYNVLHILGIALRHLDSLIPAGCEPGIWAIVRSAIADPDPQDEHDPASAALDAVRPAALQTAIQLGLWKHRADSQPPAEVLSFVVRPVGGVGR
jgi:hypothetical protein